MAENSGVSSAEVIDRLKDCAKDVRNGAAEKVAASCGEPRARNVPQRAAPESSQGIQESTKADSVPYTFRNADALKVLSKRELIALLTIRPIVFDEMDLASMRRHTLTRLEKLCKRVREGKFVDEAVEFVAWLRMSGVLTLIASREAEQVCREIGSEVEAAWKRDPRGPWVSKSELEALNHKIDLMAGRLSQVLAAETPTKGVEPALRVLP